MNLARLRCRSGLKLVDWWAGSLRSFDSHVIRGAAVFRPRQFRLFSSSLAAGEGEGQAAVSSAASLAQSPAQIEAQLSEQQAGREQEELFGLRLRTLIRTKSFHRMVLQRAPNLTQADMSTTTKEFLLAVKSEVVKLDEKLKKEIEDAPTTEIVHIDSNKGASHLLDANLVDSYVQFVFARKRERDALQALHDEDAVKTKPSGPELEVKLPGGFGKPSIKQVCVHQKEMDIFTNLTSPHEWFPVARNMKRTIHLHVGPTNSGKTYNAMQRLTKAESGVFCSPLRLLAAEIHEKLTKQGVLCNLLTGQEVVEVEGAKHTACTVEMCDTTREVEVAVVDETQLIGDRDRGSAWTRAILGLAAKEVHLCGSDNMVDIVAELCLVTGDAFQVHHYTRLTPLRFEEPLRGWSDIRKGDCVIGFSRKSLYQLKREIERNTEHKCCIVYGSLPPEIRKEQAKLFNDPASGYDVLVASDAIGMGLNLYINRVIFSTVEKFDGMSERVLLPTEVKQIAGRAGRYGLTAEGTYTTLFSADAETLQRQMNKPIPRVLAAGLCAPVEQIENLAEFRPDVKFSYLLQYYASFSVVDDIYFLTHEDSQMVIAYAVEDLPLSARDKFTFCMAPINIRHSKHLQLIRKMAFDFAHRGRVTLNLELPRKAPRTAKDLSNLELLYTCFELYSWLALRFSEESFPDKDKVAEQRQQLLNMMEDCLQRLSNLGMARSFKDGGRRKRHIEGKRSKMHTGRRKQHP